ncbi:hypothetical protein [Vibrio sp. 10N.239.312.D08]|uniref:hypothetical protein n=1 Tax=Vibrio sp. 10N.239.312.D08 TaxID=3229978 RepID=UPI00355388F7
MLNLIEPSRFSGFVAETLSYLSCRPKVDDLVNGPLHNFSQVRVKASNGNYETSCFYKSEMENPILRGLTHWQQAEPCHKKSDVVNHLNDSELFSQKVTFTGVSFEKFNERINFKLTDSIDAEIVTFGVTLKPKTHHARKKNKVLRNLCCSYYLELDDIYDVEINVTIHNHDEDILASNLELLRESAALNELVEQTPDKSGLKCHFKKFTSYVKGRIDDFNSEVRAYKHSSETKYSALAENWFVPLYPYVEDTLPKAFEDMKPICFKARYNENVEWSPFHSDSNFNVSAMPSKNAGGKLRGMLEQFIHQNTVDFSIRSLVFVPVQNYEHLEEKALQVTANGKCLFNMDPLPLITKWKGSDFNEYGFINSYVDALIEIALHECKGVALDVLKSHLRQFNPVAITEKYIRNQKIHTTKELINAMSESTDEHQNVLSKHLRSCFPEIELVFDESKPSIYSLKNTTISTNDFMGSNTEFLVTMGLQILACQSQMNEMHNTLKPIVLLIETSEKNKCNTAFSNILRLNRKLAISTIYVHSQFDDGGNLIINRSMEGASHHVLKEVARKGIFLEIGTFIDSRAPKMPGLAA